MPIYEYNCEKCHKKFDHLARTMSGDHKVACPECGSAKTARALSVFAVGGESGEKTSGASEDPMCGRCGQAPGSCGME
ncbi:MAG TPA: zinc ribbon domain-containing protein [Humisphaera sp.]|nr:zinc ribbon domain-containing protein [Humisphaera sp.]